MPMGKAVKFEHKKRCDFCKKAVSFGYYIMEGPAQGFFCGRQCLGRAVNHAKSLKKEE